MTAKRMKTGLERLGKLWKRARTPLVAEVPDDCWYCEFECRKPECSLRDWNNCLNRKRQPLPGTEQAVR